MLYLIHFSRPFKHAGHYRGYCEDGKLERRIAKHRSGRGAKLLKIIQEAGITWEVVATFEGDRKAERNLKKRPIMAICPTCNPSLVKHDNAVPNSVDLACTEHSEASPRVEPEDHTRKRVVGSRKTESVCPF